MLGAVAELTPALGAFRIFSPQKRAPAAETAAPVAPASSAIGETELATPTEQREDLAQPEHVGAPTKSRGPIAERDERAAPEPAASGASPVPIVDERRSLDWFFAALARTEAREPNAVSRVLFFGDSVVASDFGTGTVRRLLQGRFGDAGHGFMLVASAWPQYFHNDVYRLSDRGFRVSRVVGPRAADRLYGLGGVTFTGAPGLRARAGTAKSGTFGRRVSRFEVWYLEQPDGGTVNVSVDGQLVRTIDTSGPAKQERVVELRVPDGEHEFELYTVRGTSRLFGVVLERDEPGVVLDAIGLVGARLRTLAENDPDHFAASLARRRPDLVVYQFGANESGDGFAYPMPEYHASMRALIEHVAKAVPGASCLVIGAMDRARKENDRLVTVPVIPLIVEEQRKVAAEVGCAFFSAYDAMGGRGSMAAWVRQGLGAGDFTHPTSFGAEKLGKWIDAALMARYAEYRARAR